MDDSRLLGAWSSGGVQSRPPNYEKFSRVERVVVATGLEHAEVVRKLAPCIYRLDVRDSYLVVSAIAPVGSPTSRILAVPSVLDSQPHHRQPNPDCLTPRDRSGSVSAN
jgi:hypothetical protein